MYVVSSDDSASSLSSTVASSSSSASTTCLYTWGRIGCISSTLSQLRQQLHLGNLPPYAIPISWIRPVEQGEDHGAESVGGPKTQVKDFCQRLSILLVEIRLRWISRSGPVLGWAHVSKQSLSQQPNNRCCEGRQQGLKTVAQSVHCSSIFLTNNLCKNGTVGGGSDGGCQDP